MKKVSLIILLIFSQNIYSQKIDGICNEDDYFGIPLNKIEYVRYNENTIKERYVNFSEVKNNTPEELLKSMMSAKNNKWVSFNYGQEMNWTQDQFDRLNDPKKHVELLCKIDFIINKDVFSIIKLNLFDGDKKPQYLSLVIKKKEERWVINTDKTLSDISFLIMFTSIDDIDSIFNNTSTDNEKLNQVISDSWNNNTLDLSKIVLGLGKLMLNSEYKSLPTDRKKNILELKNKIISVIYNYPLLGQKFCNYFPNEISNYSNQELDLLLTFVKSKQEEKTSIIPVHKFSYFIKGEEIIVLKYLIKNSNNEELQSEQFIIRNNTVSVKETNGIIEKNIFNAIKDLKSEAIIQFSNVKNNSDYTEINKLKAIVNDSRGVLNIEELTQIIKENKATLSKYID